MTRALALLFTLALAACGADGQDGPSLAALPIVDAGSPPPPAACVTPQGVLECGPINLALGQPPDVHQCGFCPIGDDCTIEAGACPPGVLSCCLPSALGECETGAQECLDPASRLNAASGGAQGCTNDELSLAGVVVDGVRKRSYPGQDACTGQDFSCGTCPPGFACDDQALGEGNVLCPPGFGTCCILETEAQLAALHCQQTQTDCDDAGAGD